MNIFYSVPFCLIIIPSVLTLKCRTREHMRQQQDFYNLASTCMQSSMNMTQQNGGTTSSMDYRLQRPLQQNQQFYQQQHQQQQNQQGNRFNFDNYYDTNRNHDNRYDRDRNRPNYGYNDENTSSRNPNVCVNPENYNYRENSQRDEMRHSRYRNKRDVIPVQKYVRKNSTAVTPKKSPLEDIGALNNENKADRQSMSNIMTNRIRDPELKEFIQDSIEECFDIMDSDNREEPCDFSKKLILCLEEKAKRGCEDWEIRENPTQVMNFTLNNNDFDRLGNNNNKYDGNDHKNNNGFTRRYPNFNFGQRKL